MASINSPFRSFIKPILYNLIGEKGYSYFQYLGKINDIKQKLVDEDELELLPKILAIEDETIDIGANYAYITHRLANICTKGKVYAFEPIPFTFNVCKKVIKKYKFKNVSLFQKGVGSKNEKMQFSVPTVDFGGMSAGQAHMSVRNNELFGKDKHYKFSKAKTFICDVVAIDSFLPDLKKLTFVKIDIEGAELFALQGMRNTIKKFLPIILMEINPFFLKGFGIAEKEIHDFFTPLQYQIFIYDKEIGKLIEYPKDGFVEKNYLMLHKNHITKLKHLIQN